MNTRQAMLFGAEEIPQPAFAALYRTLTGLDLQRGPDCWRLHYDGTQWHLPRAVDALRITHIGDRPATRVVDRYLGNAPWPREDVQTVVDVGAFVGEFMRGGGFAGLAIEPDGHNAWCAWHNLECPVVEAVAWYEDDTVAFRQARDGSESSVGSPDGSGTRHTTDVTARRVSDIVDDHGLGGVDLVKVDAEGAEVEAVAGAVELRTRFAVDVGPERGGHDTADAVAALLQSHDYRTSTAGNILYAEPEEQDT